jgi:acyl-CoA synthetase (AMP-forming)/AMP-acid ligase II
MIHSKLEEMADREPDRIALRTPQATLTFHALAGKVAGAVARVAGRVSPGSGQPVALWLDDPLEGLAFMIGLAQLQLPVIPLDPAWTYERKREVLARTTPAWVFTDQDPATLPPLPAGTAVVAAAGLPDGLPGPAAVPGGTGSGGCWLFAGCGDTGSWVGEGAFARYLQGRVPGWAPEAGAVVGLAAPVAVADWVRIVLPALNAGNAVRIWDAGEPRAVAGVTHAYLTGRDWADLMESDQGPFGSVRAVLSFTDARVPEKIWGLPAIRQQFPGLSGMVRLFGLPESGFANAGCRVPLDAAPDDRTLLGTPLRPGSVHLLNKKQKPVPAEMAGDLYLPVEGLAAPAGQTGAQNLLNTGMKARFTDTGSLELLKENPASVWLDGIALPVAALEAALRRHPGVRDACLPATADRRARAAITLFIETTHAWADLPALLAAQLGEGLAANFQGVALPAFPRLPEGQIDEPALAALSYLERRLIDQVARRVSAVREIDGFVTLVKPAAVAPTGGATAPTIPAARRPTGNGPAEYHAGSVIRRDDDPHTLAEGLLKTVERFPGKAIRYVSAAGTGCITYSQLLAQSLASLAGLRAAGLGAGDRVIIQVRDLPGFLPVFWACQLGGISPLALAVPAVYQQGHSPADRLLHAWQVMEKPVILACPAAEAGLAGAGDSFPMPGRRVVGVAALGASDPAGVALAPGGPASTAFFLLTSGSTGNPKCIQITQQGALAHLLALRQAHGYGDTDVVVNVLPIDHITPLLLLHVRAVVLGADQVHVHTDHFVNNPLVWLDTLEQYKGTHTFSPNFAYQLVTDALAGTPPGRRDLSSVRQLVNGGELISYPVARNFLAAVLPFGVPASAFRPAYGMTELAGAVTLSGPFDPACNLHFLRRDLPDGDWCGSGPDDPEAAVFFEVGEPLPGTSVRITDAQNQLLPKGRTGRIQFRGEVVTPGYLNDAVATRDAFTLDGWFTTGDLGFLAGGRLTVTGREKDLIIIRGVNYHCHELEEAVGKVPGVQASYAAAVAATDAAGVEGVALFFSPKAGAWNNRDQIAGEIRTRVAVGFGITPAAVVPLPAPEFPKTESGKINRQHLRTRLAQGDFAGWLNAPDPAGDPGEQAHLVIFYTAPQAAPDWGDLAAWVTRTPHLADRVYLQKLPSIPRTPAGGVDYEYLHAQPYRAGRLTAPDQPAGAGERRLMDIWREVLQVESVKVHDHFFARGGDSLKATQVISRIYQEWRVKLELGQLFAHPTVQSLAGLLGQSGAGEAALSPVAAAALSPVAPAAHYPLSRTQKQLWILAQTEKEHIAYQMPVAVAIRQALDVDAFTRAFKALVARHESLRTYFVTREGEPRQCVHAPGAYDFAVPCDDLRGLPDRWQQARQAARADALLPFDLQAGPPLRARLLCLGPAEFVFLFTMHHIISDGWSMKVLLREVLALYAAFGEQRANPLEPLRIQYKDYVAWQASRLAASSMQEHRQYWHRQLGSPVTPLALPFDFTPCDACGYEGSRSVHWIGEELTAQLNAWNQQRGVTLFMTLTALLKVLLYRHTGQDDILVGSPVAGRDHPDLEGQIGLYLNNLVLRDQIHEAAPFSQWVEGVKQTILEAYQHREYPYDALVEELDARPAGGRNPFYDVMLVMDVETQDEEAFARTPGFENAEVLEVEYPVSKLDLTFFFKAGSTIRMEVEYRTALFRPETVDCLAADFVRLTGYAMQHPDNSLKALRDALKSVDEIAEQQHFAHLLLRQVEEDF